LGAIPKLQVGCANTFRNDIADNGSVVGACPKVARSTKRGGKSKLDRPCGFTVVKDGHVAKGAVSKVRRRGVLWGNYGEGDERAHPCNEGARYVCSDSKSHFEVGLVEPSDELGHSAVATKNKKTINERTRS
jgi:hypothetical protein